MLKFYYSGAPNPMKVALFLEEAGLPYEAIPVDTRKGVLTIEADAQAGDPSPDVAIRIRCRLSKGRWIAGIGARDGVEHDGDIGDPSRHRPDVVE